MITSALCRLQFSYLLENQELCKIMGKWYGKYKVSSPSENALPGSTHAGCPKESLHIFFLSQTKPKKNWNWICSSIFNKQAESESLQRVFGTPCRCILLENVWYSLSESQLNWFKKRTQKGTWEHFDWFLVWACLAWWYLMILPEPVELLYTVGLISAI